MEISYSCIVLNYFGIQICILLQIFGFFNLNKPTPGFNLNLWKGGLIIYSPYSQLKMKIDLVHLV
jgi:hypothetical protein